MEIGLVTLVVEDYDEAVDYFVSRVGFELVEDSPTTSSTTGQPKRWVVVRPPGAGTALLLAEAADGDQKAAIGTQTGGRVSFFLNVDDFDAAHDRMVDAGVDFAEAPRVEPYGKVAVWEDLYGNRWDLIGPSPEQPVAAYPPPDDIDEVLYSETQIADRVTELGAAITADYDGRVPLLVSILKGSMVFAADLMRAVAGPVEIDVMAVSSYGEATESSGVVRIIKDLDQDVAGRDVIVVEDIVDSGLTLRYLLEYLGRQGPASLTVCTLLLRDGNRIEEEIDLDYVGFRLPSDAFVIGYGLDVAQRYRNLPFIATYAG